MLIGILRVALLYGIALALCGLHLRLFRSVIVILATPCQQRQECHCGRERQYVYVTFHITVFEHCCWPDRCPEWVYHLLKKVNFLSQPILRGSMQASITSSSNAMLANTGNCSALAL